MDGDARGAGTKWFRNSVGAIVELKQDGQILKDGRRGSVSQSLCPRVNVVRGQDGNGAMAPRSMSSEYRRYAPNCFLKFVVGGWNDGGCQLDTSGLTLENILSSN